MPQPPILTPEQFVAQVERAWPQSTVSEREKLLTHARAWAVVSYDGDVPEILNQQFRHLEAQDGNAR